MPNTSDNNNTGSTQTSRIVRVRDVSFFDNQRKYLFDIISYQFIMIQKMTIFIDILLE
jgi:hypothetical protein